MWQTDRQTDRQTFAFLQSLHGTENATGTEDEYQLSASTTHNTRTQSGKTNSPFGNENLAEHVNIDGD